MNKNLRKAILKSIEHWHQNLDMLILNNLSNHYLIDDISILGEDCALCIYLHSLCCDCPLYDNYKWNCCKEYQSVINWYYGNHRTYTIGYKVISVMLEKLYSLLD
jgi:hypothetical protein